jgi:hypothetical protein
MKNSVAEVNLALRDTIDEKDFNIPSIAPVRRGSLNFA